MSSTRSIRTEYLDSATRLVASAFYNNPAHIYICPDPDTRLAKLEWFLGRNLKMQAPHWSSFCLVEDDCVNAMGFWTIENDPQGSRAGLLDMIRSGVLMAPIRLGASLVRRMLEVAEAIDGAADHASGDERYWYLHNLVVHEKLRGKGVGGNLMREQLERIECQDPGALVVLATQLAENVRFYERFGFQVVAEDLVGKSEHAFKSWTMQARVVGPG